MCIFRESRIEKNHGWTRIHTDKLLINNNMSRDAGFPRLILPPRKSISIPVTGPGDRFMLQLPIAFCSVVGNAKHLTVVYIGYASVAPRCHMIRVHFV